MIPVRRLCRVRLCSAKSVALYRQGRWNAIKESATDDAAASVLVEQAGGIGMTVGTSSPPRCLPFAQAVQLFVKMMDTAERLEHDGWEIGVKVALILLNYTATHRLGLHALRVVDFINHNTRIPEDADDVQLFALDAIALRALTTTDGVPAPDIIYFIQRFKRRHSLTLMPTALLVNCLLHLLRCRHELVKEEGRWLFAVLLRNKAKLRIQTYTVVVESARNITDVVSLVNQLKNGDIALPHGSTVDATFYGIVLMKCNELQALDEAHTFFEEAMHQGFSCPRLWKEYLSLLCKQGKMQKACALFQRAPAHHREKLLPCLLALYEPHKKHNFALPFAKKIFALSEKTPNSFRSLRDYQWLAEKKKKK